MSRRKYNRSEDMVGKTYNNGNLRVVEIHETRNGKTYFKVVCSKCSVDKELFPLGYFVTSKDHINRGVIPCGCSKTPRWCQEQYLILVNRVVKSRFLVHGFSEGFHGKDTKLKCECPSDNHIWYPRIKDIIRGGGCPKCKYTELANKARTDPETASMKCKKICEAHDYTFIGFVGKYTCANTTRFQYMCSSHGLQNVKYSNFVNNGTRCGGCWKEQQKLKGHSNGYYPERKGEQDYLYTLSFDNQFIKVGRSFNVDNRIDDLGKPSVSGINNIIKLRIFTATHQEIYDYEQELHYKLRCSGFQHGVDWSTECFKMEAIPLLSRMLDCCDFKEVIL